MKKYNITKQQARRFLLSHQGLLPPHNLKGEAGVMEFIEKVGCIQFDPLNIVGRNSDLVLQARINGYKHSMLEKLLYKERKLIDGWDKMMAIYRTEDWPYFDRYRKRYYERYHKENSQIVNVLPYIRKEISERGPLSSIDLELKERVDWAWAPTSLSRAALESMYFWGELVIHHKINTRRVYDFTGKHLTKELLEIEDPNASTEQYNDWHVLRRIGSVGLLWRKSGDAWIGIMNVKSKERNEAIERLLEKEMLIELQVEGIKHPLYMRSMDEPTLKKVIEEDFSAAKAAIIAPLDNLLWDRKLIQELFDFEYRWEVYKPEAQRKYGYYVLPVLYGDSFAARFEAERDKENNALYIKNWWWEKDIKKTKKLDKEIADCLRKFRKFLGCEKIIMSDELIKNKDLLLISEKRV